MIKRIIKESRPATLVVTIISTTLGIISAYRSNYLFSNLRFDLLKIFLVTIAGILLQSGVNLINNFFDEEVDEEIKIRRTSYFLGYKRTENEILIFKCGLIFMLITFLIGTYLSFYSGIQLFVIELIGLFSAYAYAGRPFSYKNYGLGAVMSFIMMGPLMVYSSYLVFSKSFSIMPILYSFTFGLFIPAILLANEIRDYIKDKERGIKTLTVRIGYKHGVNIYYGLIIFAYINTIVLVLIKLLPLWSLIVVTTIPLVKNITRNMKENTRLLIPATAKLYLAFGIELLIVLILTKI